VSAELYQGRRLKDGTCEILADGVRVPLRRSLAVWNHSPTGFEWGYGGSGPAQTALAILLDYTGGKRNFCERFHQWFKEFHTARVNKAGWVLSGGNVQKFITMVKLKENALGRPLCESCLCAQAMHSEKGRCWEKGCDCGKKVRS
jgi:hypothetical protein